MAGKNEIKEALRNVIARKILYDEPMSRHTSLNVGGNAGALVLIKSEDQLIEVIRRLREKKVLSVEEHREAYPKALKHALRIDFRSMDLTDQEIEFLADSAITNVSFLVPADWRNQFRPQPTPRPNSIGPSDRTSPHLP